MRTFIYAATIIAITAPAIAAVTFASAPDPIPTSVTGLLVNGVTYDVSIGPRAQTPAVAVGALPDADIAAAASALQAALNAAALTQGVNSAAQQGVNVILVKSADVGSTGFPLNVSVMMAAAWRTIGS